MTTGYALAGPPERVLSTLNPDGSRRWLNPRLSPGRFLRARRIVAGVLLAIFTFAPYVTIGGRPLILLDIVHREFTVFGTTFLPTDTVLLALLLIGVIVAIFLVTAVFGRAWCGYACPQTVYMEFVYRPLDRLFDGPPRRGGMPGRKRTTLRTATKYVTCLLVSMLLAHTFLAYFVGIDALREWVMRSPIEHPTSFLVMAGTTALMMFDFGYFREQTCIVACPYGRLQSVLLDRDSLIVSYDPRRGEPRGKGRRLHADEVATPTIAGRTPTAHLGDCVDCELCVETCPTGIDIRDGLRMECIGCAQCIDACDAVMAKIGRPAGLIRYSSQARIAGAKGRLLRARIFVYPAVLLIVSTVFIVVLSGKGDTDVSLLRAPGLPFAELPNGEISNQTRLKITNRGGVPRSYHVEVAGGAPARVVLDENPLVVAARSSETRPMLIVAPVSAFVGGKAETLVRVTDGATFSSETGYHLFGPANPGGDPSAQAP